MFLNSHRSGVLTALAWLVPHETVAISAQVLCTPYNHAPCHFLQSHIRKVHACLAVACRSDARDGAPAQVIVRVVKLPTADDRAPSSAVRARRDYGHQLGQRRRDRNKAAMEPQRQYHQRQHHHQQRHHIHQRQPYRWQHRLR